jgi:membrane protein DedA with SNARE-associated domain
MLVESVGIPSPSELSLVTLGVLAGEGKLSLPFVIIVGALGSIAGAHISYWIALRGGRLLILRYGARVGLTAARLDQAEAFFRNRGDVALLVGRLISGVRAIISYPAGLFEMPYPRFLVFTSIGALLWPVLAAGSGYLVGPHWHVLVAWLTRLWIVVIALLVIAATGWIYWRRLHSRAPEM